MSQKTTKDVNQTTTTAPWSVQQPYLQDAFSQAQQLYGNAAGNQYTGDITAQFNPAQLGTFNSMVNYGMNNNIPQQTAGAGSTLTNSGVGSLTGALNALGTFKPTGTTDSTIADAQRYADNPAISGMVDAAMRDSTRNASENVLPQLARTAAMTGNTNSNRTAISQGIVQRGLSDQAADISAQLRGDAYSQGLNLAQNANQFNTTANLDALKAQGTLGGGAASTGLGALGSSIGQQGDLYGLAAAGGAGLQAADQAALDNARQKIEYGNATPWENLAKYYAIVGGNNWGGVSNTTGTTTQETEASPLSMVGAGLGTLGSLFNYTPTSGSLGASIFGNLFK